MAAPAEMTTRNISGKFVMNKRLSDDSDAIMRLQDINWFLRKGISVATVTLAVKHYRDEDGSEHIDVDQTITGGIKGTTEERSVDGIERTHEDKIFGPVLTMCRRMPLEKVAHEFLRQDWTEDSLVDGEVIYTAGRSDTARSGKTWLCEF